MNFPITIGTLGYLIFQFYILFRREKAKEKFLSLFIFTSFCEIFLNLGYFFSYGSFEINYAYISIAICTFWGVLLVSRNIVKIKIKYSILFIGVLIVGIIWRCISTNEILGIDHSIDVDELATGTQLVPLKITVYSLIVFVRNVLLIFNLIVFVEVFDDLIFKKIIEKYLPFFRGIILFSVVEFILNNTLNPMLVCNIVRSVLGSGATAVQQPYYRGGLYSILLVCREPSLANYALMFCILTIMWHWTIYKNKKDQILFIIGISMMLLSFSITGILFVMVLSAFLLVRKNIRDKFLKIIALLFGMFFLLFLIRSIMSREVILYFSTRIIRAVHFIKYIIQNPNSGTVFKSFGGASEVVRLYSIFQTFNVWISSPLIGAGIGTASACSGWVSALANVGVLGIYIWLAFFNKLSKKLSLKNYKITAIIFGMAFTIQGGLLDIFCYLYYFIWLILSAEIITNYRQNYYRVHYIER